MNNLSPLSIPKNSLTVVKDSPAKLQSVNQLKKTNETTNSGYKHVQSNNITRSSSACSLRSDIKPKNMEQNKIVTKIDNFSTDVFRNLENNIFIKKG